MVENAFSAAAFCICGVVLAVLLRQYSREQSLMLSLCVCVGVIGSSLMFLGPVISDIKELFCSSGISEEYMTIIFKAMAVCIITQITCDICRDSGEMAIASAAELWGRALLVFMSIPIIRSLLEKINEIL